MTRLEFHGYSDDTFGEYAHSKLDHDNCASGEPIRFVVSQGAEAFYVSGQYSPSDSACWSISVEPCDETTPVPDWPIYFARCGDCEYSPSLIIEVPDGDVTVRLDDSDN